MNIEKTIEHLKDVGLNIFLSIKVCELPDDIYNFSDAQKSKTLCLIGHGGKTLWKHIPDFSAADPIDNFAKKQIKFFANKNSLNIEILFPSDHYLLPLQRIGRFLNLSHPSPIGIDISNDFGLWFSFRGIFLINEDIPHFRLPKNISPCDLCIERPCLKELNNFEARLKCPFKNEHQYSPMQLDYHQRIMTGLSK